MKKIVHPLAFILFFILSSKSPSFGSSKEQRHITDFVLTLSIANPLTNDSSLADISQTIGEDMRKYADSITGVKVITDYQAKSIFLRVNYNPGECNQFPCENKEAKILGVEGVFSSYLFKKDGEFHFIGGLFIGEDKNFFERKHLKSKNLKELKRKILEFISNTLNSYIARRFFKATVALKVYPSDAQVYVDGKFQGIAEKGKKIINLDTFSNHKITIRKDGFGEKEIALFRGKNGFFYYEVNLAPLLFKPSGKGYGYIKVETQPSGARVILDGRKTGGTTPFTISKVPSGTHYMEIKIEGYPSKITEVKLKPLEVKVVKVKFQKEVGSLYVETNPAGLEIFINNKYANKSPLMLESITTGAYLVRARGILYKAVDKVIFIDNKEQKKILLNATYQGGTIKIAEIKEKVEVWVDGRRIKDTSRPIGPVIKDEHIIYIKGEGINPITSVVRVKEGEEVFFIPSVETNYGVLNVESFPPAIMVKIDGKVIGKTPLKNVKIPAGLHSLRLYHPENKYEEIQRSINIEKNQSLSLNFTLKKLTGAVRVNTFPKDAEIYIDGGKSPSNITLDVGRHILIAYKEGYIPFKKTIEVKKGDNIEVKARLVPVMESKEMKRLIKKRRIKGIVFAGTSGLLFVGSAISYALGKKYADEAEHINSLYYLTTLPERQQELMKSAKSKEKRSKNLNLAGHILTATGAITGTLGGYLLFTTPSLKFDIKKFIKSSLSLNVYFTEEGFRSEFSIEW